MTTSADAGPSDVEGYGGLCRVQCPIDDVWIKMPFVRTSGPVPYVHYRHGRYRQKPCRLVVTPAWNGGGHVITVVEQEQTIEEVLWEAVGNWQTLMRSL